LLEFAASLPPHYKLKSFDMKYIWKKALSKRVPEAILKRKKAGFPVPYESWLRNDLRGQVREILTDRKTVQRGYFAQPAVERLLAANNQHGTHPKEVFSLVALELWHRMFLDGDKLSPHPLENGRKTPELALQ
jgi:asparagine synthase (glutamine-hydrolysing)